MTTVSSSTASSSSPRNNVADYFAILGVGDKLVWKHQQKSQWEEETAEEDDDSQNNDDEDEDADGAMERFLREIVSVTILTQEVEEEAHTVASCPTDVSDQHPHLSAITLNPSMTSTTVTQPHSQSSSQNNISLQQQQLSPTTSDATSTWTSQSQQQRLLPAGNADESLLTSTEEIMEEHWTAIQQTLPAAQAGHVPIDSLDNFHEEDDDDGSSTHISGSASRRQQQLDPMGPQLWPQKHVWEANLSWNFGLRAVINGHRDKVLAAVTVNHTPLKGIRAKVESKWKQVAQGLGGNNKLLEVAGISQKFVLAYQRRRQSTLQKQEQQQATQRESASGVESPILDRRPAIADLRLFYVRLHRNLLVPDLIHHGKHSDPNNAADNSDVQSTASSKRGLGSLLLEGAFQSQARQFFAGHATETPVSSESSSSTPLVAVQDQLTLPDGFEEWSLPAEYRWIRDPRILASASCQKASSSHPDQQAQTSKNSLQTVLLDGQELEGDVEVTALTSNGGPSLDSLLPTLVTQPPHEVEDETSSNYCYVPILAIRRQRTGDEERYHEDSAIVEMAVSFLDVKGQPVMPLSSEGLDAFDMAEDENDEFSILGKTEWAMAGKRQASKKPTIRRLKRQFGSPTILVRKNLPFGFADAAFATRVLDRFPERNYKGLPLPQEELPMFCYPTGCRLHRARYSDAPLAQYYGFVVKNERGDSIYVSCVSFMEPLTSQKVEQLARMSEKRKYTSLPHAQFCERRDTKLLARLQKNNPGEKKFDGDASDCSSELTDGNFFLTGFDDMTTFENKTICLVSRYPFWTAFRKFLSHLHIQSSSVSDTPLERSISHLLLAVPLPKAGLNNVIVPLPTLNEPMVLTIPPEKDFPVVDLPYHRLVACLEINKIVMIILGMLALEKKVIVMSTRPSLVLDVCELLRSLMFPFDLCAPYVPRLTEPFKSSLDFPGAIFVGIHDDGSPGGLAATVRKELPEDSIVVDLETGEIESDFDRMDIINSTWEILPRAARSELVKELQVLCSDAGINDGQEPLDSQYDSAFEVALPDAIVDDDLDVLNTSTEREPLDDRAFRDAFLRFFCKVLGGYERFLVVPDADFLVSGNEWFDSQGFLASVRSDRAPYLGALVSTQLFQSFIQRRTEASDVHCLLFDECMEEYHAAPKPYGRLGEDMEVLQDEEGARPRCIYSLLVDQAATLPAGHEQSFISNRSFDVSESESAANATKQSLSFAENNSRYAVSAVNSDGDFVTGPTKQDLPQGQRFIYCIDGNPCFPHRFDHSLFLPKEPESWLVEMSKTPKPVLARSEKELEDADRRRRQAASQNGFQKQRRCLWQLPKLLGSHFLGAWLLCIPAQVSHPRLSHDQQSRFLTRALGALRLLRSKQRIVPDEAAYRALMVACGRSKSDRRTELVKLFGLLRSDGIFPSAVTLGQYTRSLAEGYSKRSDDAQDDEMTGIEVSESASKTGRLSLSNNQRGPEWEAKLTSMDGHLGPLEQHGRRWRNKHSSDRKDGSKEKEQEEKKKRSHKSWLPVAYSSSFVPVSSSKVARYSSSAKLVAIWSKTRACRNCDYIPLEEEVQAGWDVGNEDVSSGAISCPRCGSLFVPMLGIREFTLHEAKKGIMEAHTTSLAGTADFGSLPPQICPRLSSDQPNDIQYVAYKSPAALRHALEQVLEDHGEEILAREELRHLDPELFFNFWWYCARFSLPLPLSVVNTPDQSFDHCIAFASWDQAISERACFSAARVLSPIFDESPEEVDHISDQIDPFEDHPLLGRFNLQGYFSSVWDHEDLSRILVSLVEACDKRDFRPVVECVVQRNKHRRSSFAQDSHSGEAIAVELDVYRTILYLAKYQCTTAFHAFFPATIKPCKGYHFWCAIGQPLPIFDRLLRDGAKRVHALRVHDVSDVALGFRCVFGHLI